MTEGRISGHLIRYAVPLVLGNLFQLTYNAVDSAVVGRYVGTEALAAVGASNPVLNLVVLGLSGLCVGAGVIMSEAFGAKDEENLRKEMATTMIFGGIFSVAIMVLGILFAVPLLRLLSVPEEVLPLTSAYMRVVFLGIPFTAAYNAMAQSMKSLGDSKTPLKFLIFCSILNGVLDVIFVAILRLGAVSSAATTVASQAISAALCLWYISRKVPLLHPRKGEWRMEPTLLRRTLSYGGTTALQSCCQPIGKLMIQSVINSLGVDAMACFNAVTRMDDYACLPAQSIGQADTTFIAQNRGAGNMHRVRDGFLTAIRLELCWWPIIGLTTWFLKQPIMQLFVSAESAEVIAIGCAYLGWMSLFYVLPCLTNGCQSFFRGMGRMKMTLLGTLTQISLRVIFVYVLVPRIGLSGVAFASAIGWVGMLILEIPQIVHHLRRMTRENPNEAA